MAHQHGFALPELPDHRHQRWVREHAINPLDLLAYLRLALEGPLPELPRRLRALSAASTATRVLMELGNWPAADETRKQLWHGWPQSIRLAAGWQTADHTPTETYLAHHDARRALDLPAQHLPQVPPGPGERAPAEHVLRQWRALGRTEALWDADDLLAALRDAVDEPGPRATRSALRALAVPGFVVIEHAAWNSTDPMNLNAALMGLPELVLSTALREHSRAARSREAPTLQWAARTARELARPTRGPSP